MVYNYRVLKNKINNIKNKKYFIFYIKNKNKKYKKIFLY